MPIALDGFSKSLLKKPSGGIVLDDFGKSLLGNETSTPNNVPRSTDPRASLSPFQKVLTNPVVDKVLGGVSSVVPAAPAPPVVMPPMAGPMPPNRTRTPITSFLEGLMASSPVESMARANTALQGMKNEPGVNFANQQEYQNIIDRQKMRQGAPQNVSVPETLETPLAGMMIPAMGMKPLQLAGMMGAITAKRQLISEPIRQQIPEGTGKDVFDVADLITDLPFAKFGANPAAAVAAHKTAKSGQVLAEIAKDLPKIKEAVKASNPNLPDEVINQLTPEQIVQGAQTNKSIGDYINRVQARVSPFSKMGLQTEDVSLPEGVRPPKMPEKPINQATPFTPKQPLLPLNVPKVQNPSVQPPPTGQIPQSSKEEFMSTIEAQLKGTGAEGGSSVYDGDVFKEKTVPLDSLEKSIVDKESPLDSGIVSKWEDKIKNGQKPRILTYTVDGVTEVVDGAHKWQAYKNLGIREVPTIDSSKSLNVNEQKKPAIPPAKPPIEPPIAVSPGPEELPRNLPEIEPANPLLEGVLPAQKVAPTIQSMTGVSKPKTFVKISEEAGLKRELQQEQKASKQGFVIGKKEGRSRAIAELKNLFGNQTEALHRQSEIQRLKDDIIARDKSGAKFETYKSRTEAKADLAKREFELQRLQDDIIARDKIKVKKELIAYVKETLPKESHGNYLTAIGNADTAAQASHVFRRVWQDALDIERKDTVEKLKTASAKALKSGEVAVEYKKMIEEIMGGIELTKRRPETLDRLRRTREFIDKQRAAGKDVEMPDRILNQLEILNRRDVNKLSMAELKNILANIEDFVKLGETKLRSRQAIYDLQKERITKELLEGGVPLDKNELIAAAPGEKLTTAQKFQNVFNSINQGLQHLDLVITPMDTFFDLLDGGSAKFDGPNYRNIKKVTDTNYQSYLRMANKYVDQAISLARELKLDDQNFERIGVHAARMQKDGIQKLIDTGLTLKQINAIELTENEMKFYKMMRKSFDELRPAVAETMKNVYNEPLGEVEHYVSFMTDFSKMSDTEIFRRVGENTPEIKRPRKDTEKGFTKSRVGGAQPIKLNAMDIYLRHIDNVAYLVSMSRDNRMLFEIINSPNYGKSAGDLGQRMSLEWIDLVARKGGMAGDQRIAILDIMRRNFGLAQLGLNVTSAIIQPTALLDGAALIGNYAFDGTYQVISNPEVRAFILENMPEVKNRIGDDPAYLDFGDNKFVAKAQQVGYAPIKFFDGVTAMGVAHGAYMQKMAELKKPIDLENPNKEALSYAQEIVRRTQSSGSFKDAPPAISRGRLTGNRSFDKALLQFQSFMLTRWSNMRNYIWRANIQGGRKYQPGDRDFKKVALAVSMLILAALIETSSRRGVKWGQDKLTGKVTPQKQTFTDDFSRNLVSTVPFVSQAVSVAVYKGDIIPSWSGLRDVAGATRLATGKKPETKEKGAIDLLAGIGSLTGIPGTAQAAKIARSAVDSDTKENVVSLYEQALRTENDKEFKRLKERADQLAVEQRILKEDAMSTAEGRIRKEIIGLYEQALIKEDKGLVKKADKIAEVAGFDEDVIADLEESAQNRLDKAADKHEALEEQSRSYKPRPGIFEEAKKLISSLK